MKKVLVVDERIPECIIKNLKEFRREIIKISGDPKMDEAIRSHPDMNVIRVKNKTFAFESTNVRFFNTSKILIPDKQKLHYPDDVLMNAVCVGNDFICRRSSVAGEILDYAEKSGMRIINVNQGYVKCNIAVVSELHKAIITEDIGIADTLKKYSYNVLLLKTHGVKLNPYDYGFIGGASGIIENNLIFCGNIKNHAEYDRIIDFCKTFDVNVVSLSDHALYDYGSILEFISE